MSTVVSFHAHPDDEVLYTGGTLARAAAEGHRVVIVVATDEMGPVPEGGSARLAELRESGAILGAHRVEHLGYAGSPPEAITHRVNVRRYARQKQTALTAHHFQVNG